MSRIRRTRRVTVALCAATALGLGATGAAFAQQSGPAGGRLSSQAGGHEYPGAGQGKVTPVPAEFRAGAGERSLTAAAGITRSEVIARAKSWVGKGLDYSWTNYYQGYRMDCSGYVSMAWGLGSSLATPNFVPGGSAEWITKAELKAGDALLDDDSGADGHIVLFEEWASADKSSYWGYEFTPSGVHHRILPYPYYAGKGPFAPVRLKNIVDDTIPEAEAPKEDTSSRINADFHAYGRADLAAMYGYEDGTVSMFTFKSQTDGGFVAPVKSWTTEPGNWNFSNVKLTAGDYDGDGRADAAAFYGYSDGRAALYTFNTKTDGTFNSPVRSWNVPADNWWGENVQIASGDYDNNGRADVAAFYGYSDGRAALYTFKPDTTGKFASPLRSWNVPADYWWGEHVKLG